MFLSVAFFSLYRIPDERKPLCEKIWHDNIDRLQSRFPEGNRHSP